MPTPEHKPCIYCKKLTISRLSPARHFTSPNKLLMPFCNKKCLDKYNLESRDFFVELDRNASDSECFEHDHWEGKMRVGKCKITGQVVRVEPLMPGDNSGQPIECYNHFKSRYAYPRT